MSTHSTATAWTPSPARLHGHCYAASAQSRGSGGRNASDLAKLSAENRRDLLEIVEDRHGVRSTIVTSQLPVEKWHAVVGDPTLADAILDRLVHRAYQLNLKGESMRKRRRALSRIDRHSS